MLTLAVLGPVEARRDGVAVPVPGGKTAELLVRLALEAGTPVRAERLLADLWPSDQNAARNTLQSKVSRLRRALGASAVTHSGDAAYVLGVSPDDVDALRVLDLSERATHQLSEGRTTEALETCRAGLRLFRGDVLASVGDADWAGPFRARLETALLSLTTGELGARVTLGAGEEIVADLEQLVAAHPLHERPWVLLATALYRCGRQSDALAACARVRRLLTDELGVDPGPELVAVELQVLRHDPALTVTSERVRTHPSRAVIGNAPVAATAMVGRTDELHRLRHLVDTSRLVTLTGPAGVGKTRLAVEVAGHPRVPGGAWFVGLESAVDEASVWRCVGEALSVDGASSPRVLARLSDVDALVVLDNCEHVVDAVADVVEEVLGQCPHVRVLATSQRALHLEVEHVLDLAPLDLEDSVRLFEERAASQRGSSAGEGREASARPDVEDVCRALDGLPLAIELAAARTRVLTVPEIARRLSDRFGLLSDPTSRSPTRRRTLRAAIEWSHDLLFPDDQRGLWALASFSGGAPLPAVEAVLTALGVPEGAALDVVTRLVDRSLASVEVTSDGPARFTLLDSVQTFGREKLDDVGLAGTAAAAHARWYAAAADGVAAEVRGHGQAEALRTARTERANVEAALVWCALHEPRLGLRIALGFAWAWVVLGVGLDGASRLRAALDAVPDATDAERASGLTLCGWFEASGGNLARAVADVEEAIRLGADEGRAVSQLHLAFVHTQAGRAAEALEQLEACRGVLESHDLQWEVGASWLLEAWARISLGDVPASRRACDAAVLHLEPLGDAWALAHAEGLLGELALAEGRHDDAVMHLSGAARAAGRLRFDAAQAHHLLGLGRAQHLAGDADGARASLQRAVHLGVGCGDLRTVAFARTRLAVVLRDVGEAAAAGEVVGPARRWFDQAGGGDGALLAECVEAALAVDARAAGAVDRLQQLAGEASTAGDHEAERLSLEVLADAGDDRATASRVRGGQPDRA